MLGLQCVSYPAGVIATGDPRKLREESDNPVVRAFFRREVLAPAGAA